MLQRRLPEVRYAPNGPGIGVLQHEPSLVQVRIAGRQGCALLYGTSYAKSKVLCQSSSHARAKETASMRKA